MKKYLMMSLAALACAGCASNRMDNDWLSTAGSQFSVRKDPIVPIKQRVDKKATEERSKEDKNDKKKAYYDNPSLQKMIAKYYARSQEAEAIEAETKGGDQVEAKPQSRYANILIDYRAAGFDASRGICEYALNRLGEAHSDYRFANKSFNVGAGGVSSLMGIFQASAKSISVTATSFSLLQAWSQDFEEYAYLTASIGTVGEKVKAAQDVYRKGVEGQSADQSGDKAKDPPKGKYDVLSPRSWSDATLQIQQYNSYCLATGMRTLVEKAVGKAEVYFDDKSGTVEFFSTQNLQQLKLVMQQKERTTVVRDIQAAYKKLVVANADKATGVARIKAAQATVNALKTNPFYDSGKTSVDVAKADAAVLVASQAVQADATSAIAAQALKRAQTDASNARELAQALAELQTYGPTWQTDADKAIQDAQSELDTLQKRLDALPTGVN